MCNSKEVRQSRSREGTKIYPSWKLRVFVDDISALVKGKNKEVVEIATKRKEVM